MQNDLDPKAISIKLTQANVSKKYADEARQVCVIRFYPTIRILTGTLREIPTKVNFILSSMQNNLHTKAISIKLTQANVPKKYADEARQVCVIRFYPTVRILTGTLREIPTKVNFILSSMQSNLDTKAISIKSTQANLPENYGDKARQVCVIRFYPTIRILTGTLREIPTKVNFILSSMQSNLHTKSISIKLTKPNVPKNYADEARQVCVIRFYPTIRILTGTLREIPTKVDFILSSMQNNLHTKSISIKLTQPNVPKNYADKARQVCVIRFYPTIRILTGTLREIPTKVNFILPSMQNNLHTKAISIKLTQANVSKKYADEARQVCVIRFYPTVRILTGTLREIPTKVNFILSSMQNNLHTKAISIKLTQANVPKKYADEARQVCVIRFYPTIRILTGTLREIPTKVNFILSSMQNNLHTKAISIKLTQAKVPKNYGDEARQVCVIRFYPTIRILTGTLREIPTKVNFILSSMQNNLHTKAISIKLTKPNVPKKYADEARQVCVIRFYPTIRILTGTLREIPTKVDFILSSMQSNLHTKAISIKLTQANVPKNYGDEARQVCVIRFYPTVRILTGTLREIPTKVNFILSSMQNNLDAKAISIKLTQANVPKNYADEARQVCVIRFYPTIKILTGTLGEIPTKVNFILSSMQNNLHTKAISIKSTQAHLPENYASEK